MKKLVTLILATLFAISAPAYAKSHHHHSRHAKRHHAAHAHHAHKAK